MRKSLLALVVAVALVCGVQAFAIDGVVLIDQTRALMGNVTPGDMAGFPISINQPGSYRLSANLTVPPGVGGIEIAADDVTIDLNGFRISTSGGFATCIRDTGTHNRLEVTHGTLSGFGSGIFMLSTNHVIVRDVRTTNVSSISIVTGSQAIIQRNLAQGLIQASCPSVITENITEGFLTVVLGSGGEQCVRYNNRSLNFTGAVTQ